ncbi:hypothetical protein ACVWWR_002301 [Bradyrhizobium sp. LM3.2]
MILGSQIAFQERAARPDPGHSMPPAGLPWEHRRVDGAAVDIDANSVVGQFYRQRTSPTLLF